MSGKNSELCYKSAIELRGLLVKRELSVRELTLSYLERIEEINPKINAIVALRAEEALAEAEILDRVGDFSLPLFGLPVTIKGTTETSDLPTTYGSLVYRDYNPGYNALIVDRIKKSGAVVIGKTNTPEFSLSAITDNKLYGPSLNPWDICRTVGGSSGGAAGATAAGLSPLSQGSDGGGSLRLPASSCGVFTIKPTRGRVPYAPASYESWAGLSTNGPITRTVLDSALLLDAMTGPVVGEPYGLPLPECAFTENCSAAPCKKRLAYTLTPPHGCVSSEVSEKFMEGIVAFESLGYDPINVAPDLGGLLESFMVVVAANTLAMLKNMKLPAEQYDQLSANTLSLAVNGAAVSGADYCLHLDNIRFKSAQIMAFWEQYDYLVTPTLTSVAPRLDEVSGVLEGIFDWGAFTYPFNMSGQPAVSLPCGFGRESGLPVGLQVVGAFGDESGLFALSAQFEEAMPWRSHLPL